MSERQREDKSLLKESLPLAEEKILSFWKEIDLLGKIEEKGKKKKGINVFSSTKEFVFYEGPPTANGRPGIHHLLSRAFKDVVLRYKTMQGYHVRRRGGWDTHGLPVELQVEKEIGIKSKKDIEEYGVEEFNEKCKESVWTYMEEWERFTDRIGYLLDQKNAYITYKPEYIESVWNIVSKIANQKIDGQDLLYKDYKVVPWCPRCGTALSSHELAQGYEDDKDLSVYVKFPIVGEPNTFFLAWTTTPWTLPGHVALAVGNDIEYLKVKSGDEFFILAKNRLGILSEHYEIIDKTIIGKDLVGKKYLPPYDFLRNNLPVGDEDKLSRAFQVYPADFVNTEDGTGIVHTAVMYGHDDFELGTKIGLPKYHLVDESGHFIKGTGFLEGRFVKEEATDVEIIKDLAHRGLLFKKEKYEHSYPHCWRCKTPLIYYARDSWYIAMSKLRDKLISENKKIHWEPEYIKEGRFGEWLSDVKDWAISRERYWGTPLPMWLSEDGEKIVVDSVDTLKKYSKKSKNKYFVARHGWSDSNESGLINGDKEKEIHLTEKGKIEIKKSAVKLKKEKITKIFASEFKRAIETANLLKKEANIHPEILIDARLNERKFGDLEGSDRVFYKANFSNNHSLDMSPPNGETLREIRKRVGEFIYEIENKYENETILIVSHGDPLWMLDSVASGLNDSQIFSIGAKRYMDTGDVRALDFTPLPHDKDFGLDLHKPFIDDVILVNPPAGGGKEFRRVKEVMDVWFDSGAMPFAQDHYPFENKKWVNGKGYPADYICEGLDQTRGWFYTLHAIGNLIGKGRAYKNVICLGLVLDKEGRKMSKSVGNVVDPWLAMEEFGADPLRFWMFAVKEPGESKNFDGESVKEIYRKVFNLLTNVYLFYETYGARVPPSDKSDNILDKWILSKLSELSEKVSKGMDSFKIMEPTRSIRDFIADFSQWYIRRSRERMKDRESDDSRWASATTLFVLHDLARIMAPFTPFYAEMLWRAVRQTNDTESVHLALWPKLGKPDRKLIQKMSEVRDIVSQALELRSRANIKIRQPLKTLKIKVNKPDEKFLEIIKDELNVKEVIFDQNISQNVELDTEMTEELKREGEAREFLRMIQEKRKELNLTPNDLANIKVEVPDDVENNLSPHLAFIKKQGNIKEINFVAGSEIKIVELTVS